MQDLINRWGYATTKGALRLWIAEQKDKLGLSLDDSIPMPEPRELDAWMKENGFVEDCLGKDRPRYV
jgi:hypothetical protein